MLKVIIVGAGGLAGEVCSQLLGDYAHGREWIVEGFIDDRYQPGSQYLDLPILSSIKEHKPQPDNLYVIGIAAPHIKKSIIDALEQKGAEFIPVCTRVTKGIHTSLGNTFYGLGAAIGTNSVIGDYNYIESEVLIGHDVHIGRYCHIGPRTFIAGDVRIGDFVMIHGAASIARGVQIGHNAVIGLGAVVMRDVPENAVVMGNPAKQIK